MRGKTFPTIMDFRGWRLLMRLSQTAAAEKLGVPLRTYCNWERGAPVRHPRVLALALGAVIKGIEPWRMPEDVLLDTSPLKRGPKPRNGPVREIR